MWLKHALRAALVAAIVAAAGCLLLAWLVTGVLLEGFANSDLPQGAATVRVWPLWILVGGLMLGTLIVGGCVVAAVVRWGVCDVRRLRGTADALWLERNRIVCSALLLIASLVVLLIGFLWVTDGSLLPLLPGVALLAAGVAVRLVRLNKGTEELKDEWDA